MPPVSRVPLVSPRSLASPLRLASLAVPLALALTACGAPAKPPPDETPPSLVSNVPVNGATDVDPSEPSIMLTFSEAMDEARFAFDIDPAFIAVDAEPDEAMTVTWNPDHTSVTVRPSASQVVLENTTFTLLLTSASDEAGNTLTGDDTISFTTGEAPPTLLSSSPTDGATDVPIVAPFEVQLTFSKPMAEATVEPTVEPDNANAGSNWAQSWNGDATVLTLSPTLSPFAFVDGTSYTLLVSGTSVAGRAMTPATVSFQTVADMVPPTVIRTSPTADATDRPLTPLDVFLYFDDLMDADATLAAVSSSVPLPCTWQHFFTTDQAEDPTLESALACRSTTDAFEPSTTYELTLGVGAKDTAGNALGAPFAFSFTTEAAGP